MNALTLTVWGLSLGAIAAVAVARVGGRLRHALAQQGLHGRRVGGFGQRAAAVQDLQPQDVARLEHRVDVVDGDRTLVLAQQVQQVLLQVREGRDLGAAQHGGAALDGVHRAEDRVQVVGMGRIGVHAQQDRLDVRQVLLRLLEEDGAEGDRVAEAVGGLEHGAVPVPVR